MNVAMDAAGFLRAALGGALIGAAASLYLLTRGAPAGVSSIVGDALEKGSPGRRDAFAFVGGLVVAGLLGGIFVPSLRAVAPVASLPALAVAGLLVGFGTRLGSGCTSGHGVCGLSRFSLRSLIATLTFMFVAGVMTYAIVHGANGS